MKNIIKLSILAVFFLLSAYPVHAGTKLSKLTWEAPTDGAALTGYYICYGLSEGDYQCGGDIGNVTEYLLSDLPQAGIDIQEGTLYYIAVKAWNANGTGDPSNSVAYCPGYSTDIAITSPADNTTTSDTVTFSGTVSECPVETTVTWKIESGSSSSGGEFDVTGTTWTVSSVPLELGKNTFTIYSKNCAGYSDEMTMELTYAVDDTSTTEGTVNETDSESPVVTITSPTSSTTYSTSSGTITISGTASDNVGVASVTWANAATGSSGTASGTTSWSMSGIILIEGSNTITVTASDAGGNTATDTLTITYTVADTTAPVVAITSPTSSTTYSTSSGTITISGTASDSVGVTSVTWANAATGSSGTASGTTSWSKSGITLIEGSNTITVTASDSAGNKSYDTLTVTYSVSATVTADTTAPSIAIVSPTTSSTYSTTTAAIALSGTAGDNVGVTAVTWANSTTGSSGTASGTTSWSVSSISLQEGANTIAVAATDSAGNTASAILTVTYSAAAVKSAVSTSTEEGDTTAPVVTITSPTKRDQYSSRRSTVKLAGTASDNVGVTQVIWINTTTGSGGTATGTTSWSVSRVDLNIGTNIINVTAYDEEGNSSTDELIVTRRR